jgi:hypothetical protein
VEENALELKIVWIIFENTTLKYLACLLRLIVADELQGVGGSGLWDLN